MAVLTRYGGERAGELIGHYLKINRELWDAYERGKIEKDGITSTRFPVLFERYGISGDGRAAEEEYRRELNGSAVLMDGAMEICGYLAQNYELYVVTNGFSETQNRRMKDSGLAPYFRKIFISEDAESQKPQLEFFRYCFDRMENPDPSRMLIVGDSLKSDIAGGKNAGMTTCWYRAKTDDMAENTAEGLTPDYEIYDLLELKEWL